MTSSKLKKPSKFWDRIRNFFKRITGVHFEKSAAITALIVALWSLYFSNEALKLTRTQFNNANKPFLQILNMDDSFAIEAGKPFIFRYRLKNLGSYPTKILERSDITKFLNFDLKFDNLSNFKFHPQPEYVSDFSLPINIMTLPLTKEQADSLLTNKTSVYNVSIYKYQNLLTGELNQFEIILKFSNGSVDIYTQ